MRRGLFLALGVAAIAGVAAVQASTNLVTREAVARALTSAGVVTGAVAYVDGRPYRLEHLRVDKSGHNEFAIKFKVKAINQGD